MAAIPPRFAINAERKKLKDLTEFIRARWGAVLEVATALCEIKESKLYRHDYNTFDDYCKANFGISKSTAYRLISEQKTTDNGGSKSSQNGTSTDNAGSKSEEEKAGKKARSDPPERMKPYLDEISDYSRAIKFLKKGLAIVRKLEQGPSAKKSLKDSKFGFSSKQIATAISTLRIHRPIRMCETCEGVVDPSPDNDPCCLACDKKGYLNAEDLVRAKRDLAEAKA